MSLSYMRTSKPKPCPACEKRSQPLQDMPNRTHEEMCDRIHYLEETLEKREAYFEKDRERFEEEKRQLAKEVAEMNKKEVAEMNKRLEQLDEQSRQDREQAQYYRTRTQGLLQEMKDLKKEHKAGIKKLEAEHHNELEEQEKRLAPKRRQIEYESDEDKDACYVCGKRHIHPTNRKRERSQRRCLEREQSKGLYANTTYTAFKSSRAYKENKAKHFNPTAQHGL